MGLSFHASSFKLFGMGKRSLSANFSEKRKNVLRIEDLYNFNDKLYRTSTNILINNNITPINKYGNEETNEANNENFISVPKILFSYVPLHPIINFISGYDDKENLFRALIKQNPTVPNGVVIRYSLLINVNGEILVFNKETNECFFSSKPEEILDNVSYFYVSNKDKINDQLIPGFSSLRDITSEPNSKAYEAFTQLFYQIQNERLYRFLEEIRFDLSLLRKNFFFV